MARSTDLGHEREIEPDPAEGAGTRDEGEWIGEPDGQVASQGERGVRQRPDRRAGHDAGPPPAPEGSIRRHAPQHAADGPAHLGDREELRRSHGRDVEGVLRVEHEIGEQGGLGDRERQPAAEDDENRRAPEKLAELGQPRPLDRARGRRSGLRAVEDRDEHRRENRQQSRRRERMPPAPAPRDRRQEERRRQPAKGEAGLFHAHRDPALTRRKPLDHGAAGRGIQHAEAESSEHQQHEERAEVGAPRRERDHRADEQLTEREREAHTEAVGEPARRERHQHPAQVDRRQEEPDLHARERQRLEEKRRQRRHRQGGERAERVRDGHEPEDRPAGPHGPRIGVLILLSPLFHLDPAELNVN